MDDTQVIVMQDGDKVYVVSKVKAGEGPTFSTNVEDAKKFKLNSYVPGSIARYLNRSPWGSGEHANPFNGMYSVMKCSEADYLIKLGKNRMDL